MAENATLRAEELVPVRGRVTWGAVVAGAVLALVVYLVLTLLGCSVGLAGSDTVRTDILTTGVAMSGALGGLVDATRHPAVDGRCRGWSFGGGRSDVSP